jgi:hypothetical protein
MLNDAGCEEVQDRRKKSLFRSVCTMGSPLVGSPSLVYVCTGCRYMFVDRRPIPLNFNVRISTVCNNRLKHDAIICRLRERGTKGSARGRSTAGGEE